jgi:CBS domain-containing protein
MKTDVISLPPETSLRNAMTLFAKLHISGAPVMTGGRVTGVISSTDIMDFVAALAARSSSRAVSPHVEQDHTAAGDADLDDVRASLTAEIWNDVADGDADDAELDALDTYTVADAMTRKVIALAARTPVHVAAARMKDSRVHRVLVMHGGQLLGIVTTTDFVDAIADNRVTTRTFVFPSKSQMMAGAW